MEFKPFYHQGLSLQHLLDHTHCALWKEMGLGKSVVTLTAVEYWTYQDLSVSKTLIVAPLLVAKTVWPGEIHKWDHLNHLTYSLILGSVKDRTEAIRRDADVYVVNRENFTWLVNYHQTKWPYEVLVWDESSGLKDSQSQRFRSCKIIRSRPKRIIELTGTPSPNSLMDLWSQIYILDKGERLGDGITKFREAYFTYNPYSKKYKLREDTKTSIYQRLSDICLSMKKEDYLDLPGKTEINVKVSLSSEAQTRYDQMEEEQVLAFYAETENEMEITALNALSLNGKLLQIANGAIYDKQKKWHLVHDEKLDALGELLEQAGDQSVLVAYSYQHDLERIRKRFPEFRLIKEPKDVEDWNQGKIKRAIGHPQSIGHGNNLQFGGSIMIWFSLTYSRELYDQMNDRLDRPGQTEMVRVYRLICYDTIDQDVVGVLSDKKLTQDELMKAVKASVKARIEKYIHKKSG